MSFELDSIWQRPNELIVAQATRIVHWTKHPAPMPKPIFWQDSLCKKSKFQKVFEIHFAKAGDVMPDKIDSLVTFEQTESFIENGKLHHVITYRNLYDTEYAALENREVFTLHPRFDTIIHTRTFKHLPSYFATHPGFKDSAEIRSFNFYETNRSGGRILWINESVLYGTNYSNNGKKQMEQIIGFPEEDNSLTQFHESWIYNSGDVEALNITFYEKYFKAKVRKEIIYW